MDATAADRLTPEDVLATEAMLARPRKAPDLAAEVAAFRELSALMAADPARAVQGFLELALALCGAGSSGLSVLAEDARGQPVFRWDTRAGSRSSVGTRSRAPSPPTWAAPRRAASAHAASAWTRTRPSSSPGPRACSATSRRPSPRSSRG